MFKQVANTACNNILFNAHRIGCMAKVHQSMQRLYQAAREKNIVGQSAVARALNVSPQVVKNWESRGVSEKGARQAHAVFACDPTWLLEPSQALHTTVAEDASAVAYLAPPPDKLREELLELFSQLDDAGKKEWLADLRGFVRGRRPHPHGAASALAVK